MAIIRGNAVNVHVFLEKIVDFLRSRGYTILTNSTTGQKKYYFLKKGNFGLVLASVDSQIEVVPCRNIAGAAKLFDQPGAYLRYDKAGLVAPEIIGAVSKYYFFSYQDTDEVYIVFEYQPSKWQLMAFGVITKFTDSVPHGEFAFAAGYREYIESSGYAYGSYNAGEIFPFARNGTVENSSTVVYANFNSYEGWFASHGTSQIAVCSSLWDYLQQSASASPFGWQTVLMPMNIYLSHSLGKAPFGMLKHLRRCSIQNHLVEERITLGNDKWILFPYLQKNGYTGNLGYAIREEP